VLRYVGLMLVLVPLLIGAVSATTWYVDDDGGPGINFTQIQEAVDAAQDNDTIIVYNGTYNESLTMYKRLIVKGEGHPVVGGIRISTDGCVIDGFNVTGSKDSGIQVRSDYNLIVNNSIYNNEGDGIDLESSDYNTIMSNLVFNNSDDGIDLDDSEYNTIANNSLFNNSDDGMDIEHSFNNTLIHACSVKKPIAPSTSPF
jgi:parallel beta-helix repeat protein